MPSVKSVAVVGIGKMGEPMARRILDAGFELTVCDHDSARLKNFAALGVRTTATPAACGECDAVIVLVATPDQMRSVVLGEGGLRTGGFARESRYLVVMSTVAPRDVRELATSLAGTPIQIVDAPISGGVVAAHKGTLTVLAGGSEDAIAILQPLFDAVGKTVFHCGPLGAGETAKIVNNIIAISNMMVSAEAYRIALANGLTLQRLVPALEAGSGRNFLSKDARSAFEHYAAASGSLEDAHAIQAINRKDIDLALSIGTPELSLPAVTALRELLDKIGDETFDHWQAVAAKRA